MCSVLAAIPARLEKLDQVEAAIVQRQPTPFWWQCVRDVDGSWRQFEHLTSRFGDRYFRGPQAVINYANATEAAYLRASLAVRRQFYADLSDVGTMDAEQFCQWLDVLRKLTCYKTTAKWLHEQFGPTAAHDVVAKELVIPLARRYGDPYDPEACSGPQFASLPEAALPYDRLVDGVIVHYYPQLVHTQAYITAATSVLRKLLTMDSETNEVAYISAVADFYQLLTNLHYFAGINASLYMNFANGLLELIGLQGMPHGAIDFAALRLQPKTFHRYFYDEVMRWQTQSASFMWLPSSTARVIAASAA
jgi:hypothetical protein